MAQPILPPGKLPAALLEELLQQQETPADPRLLIGPRPGEDAAVIDFGDRLLIAKSDPITFATDAIGYYAVNVNANDIASMGGTPRWFLATLLLPEKGTTPDLVRDIFAQIREACRALQVTLVGGHTEITLGLDRPLVCGHMLGETTRQNLVTSAGAQVDDAVLLTKGYPLEGSAIIARARATQLAAQGFAADDIARWQGLLFDPGISVVRDAAVLQQAVEVHAMHDPTEGGCGDRPAGVGRRFQRRAASASRATAAAAGRPGALQRLRAGSLGRYRLRRPAGYCAGGASRQGRTSLRRRGHRLL